MISTRIKRGAVKTHYLIRNKLEHYNAVQVKRSARTVRSFALSMVALRMATLPIPMASASVAEMPLDNEPPSTQRIGVSVFESLAFSEDPAATSTHITPLATKTVVLANVAVGKSLDTLASEEAQRVQAEKEAAEKTKRERALQAQKKAAVAKRASIAPAPTVTFSGSVQDYVRQMTSQAFGESEWPAMAAIISRESGFNPNARNRFSGACGLFQALPCSKMGGMELENQVRWGIGYIRNRYGSPSGAWAFWQRNHWY
ncbi:MAG: hypothetical protein K0S20_235 [Patescibacteria group bacterium]|jgi:hypothetical protein|nr:hypothetical protein [Patescibacteria group bacterium]